MPRDNRDTQWSKHYRMAERKRKDDLPPAGFVPIPRDLEVNQALPENPDDPFAFVIGAWIDRIGRYSTHQGVVVCDCTGPANTWIPRCSNHWFTDQGREGWVRYGIVPTRYRSVFPLRHMARTHEYEYWYIDYAGAAPRRETDPPRVQPQGGG